jgi:hypothetical protein
LPRRGPSSATGPGGRGCGAGRLASELLLLLLLLLLEKAEGVVVLTGGLSSLSELVAVDPVMLARVMTWHTHSSSHPCCIVLLRVFCVC